MTPETRHTIATIAVGRLLSWRPECYLPAGGNGVSSIFWQQHTHDRRYQLNRRDRSSVGAGRSEARGANRGRCGQHGCQPGDSRRSAALGAEAPKPGDRH